MPNFTTQLNAKHIIIPHFMDVIQNNSTISSDSSNHKVHSRITKNLIIKYESHQHSRINIENKPLVESINQIHITRLAK